MRDGAYWLNLMTENEIGKWLRDHVRVVKIYHSTTLSVEIWLRTRYRNFEEFIRVTVVPFDSPGVRRWNWYTYWIEIIKKYNHDNLSPRKYLEPLKF